MLHRTDCQAIMQNLYNLSYLKCVDCGLDGRIMKHSDFPGGTLVKNLPANAGDTGLILALGKFYMLGDFAPATEPTCFATREAPTVREPVHCN